MMMKNFDGMFKLTWLVSLVMVGVTFLINLGILALIVAALWWLYNAGVFSAIFLMISQWLA